MESLLNEQAIKTEFPEEALNYAKPKITARGDLLLYILQIPKVNGNCETIQIVPLIVQASIITDLPSFVVKSGNDLYRTMKPDSIIQHKTFLEPLRHNCSLHVILGRESQCNATDSTRIVLISNNKILINNAKESQMNSNYGLHNRTLNGNFIITFFNCSVQIDEQIFTSEEVESNITEIQGAFPNLPIKWNIAQHHDIPHIHDQAILNRKQLENCRIENTLPKNTLRDPGNI